MELLASALLGAQRLELEAGARGAIGRGSNEY